MENPQQNSEKENTNNKPKPPLTDKKFPLGKVIFGVIVIVIIALLVWGLFFTSPNYSVSANEMMNNLSNSPDAVSDWSSWSSTVVDGNVSVKGWLYNGYVGIAFTPSGFNAATYIVFFDDVATAQAWYATTAPLSDALIWGPSSSINWAPAPGASILWSLFWTLIPWVIIIWVFYIFSKKAIKQQTGGLKGSDALKPKISTIKFSNIAGYKEVKTEFEELVDFIKSPEKYVDQNIKTPKGVLLEGPPGTGKTLFAKALAGEANVPFFSVSGSDFVEMFVGMGASRIRDLFKKAKEIAPSIIFIDEIDAVGRKRGVGIGGGNDEREQTLNQLLVELDGFSGSSGVMVIAATNRVDVLDSALKRSGRFDRQIFIRLPDVLEREKILMEYAKGKSVYPNISWVNIASRTPGFSGADLENVVNEAAILSVRRRDELGVSKEDVDEAIDRVMGGPSNGNRTMTEEDKKIVAIHESGHAIIGLVLDDGEKVQKISIVPRGQAGGYVLMTPKKDKFLETKAEFLAKVVSYMGGRSAEEIYYGETGITSGAMEDIKQATIIARRMVTEFGMSSLGPIKYGNDEEHEYGVSHQKYSEKVSEKIDIEINKIIESSIKRAQEIISKNKKTIDLFVEALLIKETLTAEETEDLYKNKKIPDAILNYKELLKKEEDKIMKKYKAEKKVEESKIDESKSNQNSIKMFGKDVITWKKSPRKEKDKDSIIKEVTKELNKETDDKKKDNK